MLMLRHICIQHRLKILPHNIFTGKFTHLPSGLWIQNLAIHTFIIRMIYDVFYSQSFVWDKLSNFAYILPLDFFWITFFFFTEQKSLLRHMMGEKIDALDRISDLPGFIMHHILSFLPRKEAVKTSLLSKK